MNFEEEVDPIKIERAIRQKQETCIHPSLVCPLCRLHKDNMHMREKIFQEFITVLYNNQHEDVFYLIELLEIQKRAKPENCCILDEVV